MKKSGNYITTVNKESGILGPGRFRPGPPRIQTVAFRRLFLFSLFIHGIRRFRTLPTAVVLNDKTLQQLNILKTEIILKNYLKCQALHRYCFVYVCRDCSIHV